MTCPNCGAEMEQRAFMYVCSFCGRISAAERVMPAQKSSKDATQYYKYIKRNLSSIIQNPHVDVKDLGDAFECISSKPFHPNDGLFALVNEMSFWWYARISKREIKIALLIPMSYGVANNYICIKVEENVITCKQTEVIQWKRAFTLKFDDFELLCSSTDVQFDSNLPEQMSSVNYGEFATFTRRFYNAIIDMSKYRYAIDIRLLTD